MKTGIEFKEGDCMQNTYRAGYYNNTYKKGTRIHMKSKDTMERSERRSPYESYDPDRRNKNRRPNKTGIGYMILTVLLLLFVFPVGIFFLWSRKVKITAGMKVFITLITGIIFMGLMIFAINYDTGNPRITEIQKKARVVLEKVDGYTGNVIKKTREWGSKEYKDAEEKIEKLLDIIDDKAAEEALHYYRYVDQNIYAMKVTLPDMLLEKFKDLIDYVPKAPVENIPVKLATPDMGGLNVATQNTPSEVAKVELEEEPDAILTIEPEVTPATAQTPAPTKEPEPIVLPEIKDVSLAEVFYTANGTYYHAKTNCSGMMNAVSHTLKDAKDVNKKHCDSCGVVAFSMMECENYLWVDVKNRAHTTDECAMFAQGQYKVLPFDDVYNGSYNYCEECKSTVCYDYMFRNDIRYIKDNEILDEERIALYEYEKTITVYYGVNSRNYHANAECMHMNDAKFVHTLYQALHVDMKQICELCKPLTEQEALNLLNSIEN